MAEQIEDAQVVSEGPKPPPPPPRAAKLEPAGEHFGVFDGEVNDSPNAKRKGAEGPAAARTATKPKVKGPRAPKEPTPAPVDPEEQRRLAERARRQAEKAVDGFVQLQLMMVRTRYAEVLEPDNLKDLCERLKFAPEEREGWVEPLAEGFLENGIVFPWWARLGMQAIISIKIRQVLLQQLELKVRAHQEAQARAEAEKKP